MAKATKKDKEITLETVLWNCRVALRGVGSMEKNRDAVIGLAFLKFAGDKFDKAPCGAFSTVWRYSRVSREAFFL